MTPSRRGEYASFQDIEDEVVPLHKLADDGLFDIIRRIVNDDFL